MQNLPKCRNYIIVKNKQELDEAMKSTLARFIVREYQDNIYIWVRTHGKWSRHIFCTAHDVDKNDFKTTGLEAYLRFYRYCGRDEVERMKQILPAIPKWESTEQLHYYNVEFAQEKIYKPIFVYDVNSAFTLGSLRLPEGFSSLKSYMLDLYEHKKTAETKVIRSKYKNLQNFLIGYFGRIKDFVSTRSEIIRNSNNNVYSKMIEINNNGGTVFLSNTDSIVTDEIGKSVMNKYVSDEVGSFKLEKVASKLCYRSSNAYQIDNNVTYSGVGYYAQFSVNMFEDIFANQTGSLLEGFNFSIENTIKEEQKLCEVKKSCINVVVKNVLGEIIATKKYFMRGKDEI